MPKKPNPLIRKFKSESQNEAAIRLKTDAPKDTRKKMSNKEIAYAYIVRHFKSIEPATPIFDTINGQTLRGSRHDKIKLAVLQKLGKMLLPLEKLLTRRGHKLAISRKESDNA